MIFVLPLLAVLSSAGLVILLEKLPTISAKIIVMIMYFVFMILPVKQQVETFPANYVYFNSISGGNKKAWSNYEYDYYFHALKKPAEYLVELVGNNRVSVATNCNLSNYFENSPSIKFEYARYLERSSVDWDYGLFGVNYIHPELLKNGKWQSTEIIKTFYHAGNPVVVLLKRKDKNDLLGIQKLEAGELDEARDLLEKAIHADSDNVWLFSQLAKNSLKQNDFESFNRYLQKGRSVYQYYEPFYLLEAQYLFDKKEFSHAKAVLDELIEVNPRYGKAAPLLRAVSEKLKKDS
jgi:tetratricopeptide (TPR) repeat protein